MKRAGVGSFQVRFLFTSLAEEGWTVSDTALAEKKRTSILCFRFHFFFVCLINLDRKRMPAEVSPKG